MGIDSGIVVVNLRLLERASELIARLPDSAFAVGEAGTPPVGPHFRHVLEHYSGFLAGLPGRQIDYDARARERRIETDRAAACERIRELIGGLTPLSAHDLEEPLSVRTDSGFNDRPEPWGQSTVRRELQFLQSHTTHHFALIGLLLGQQGIDPGRDFGVAPSTLRHRREQASCAPQAG
jgi:hypothetical protein